jgi:hypothetical protein
MGGATKDISSLDCEDMHPLNARAKKTAPAAGNRDMLASRPTPEIHFNSII